MFNLNLIFFSVFYLHIFPVLAGLVVGLGLCFLVLIIPCIIMMLCIR